jgi:hypothetical protein
MRRWFFVKLLNNAEQQGTIILQVSFGANRARTVCSFSALCPVKREERDKTKLME